MRVRVYIGMKQVDRIVLALSFLSIPSLPLSLVTREARDEPLNKAALSSI